MGKWIVNVKGEANKSHFEISVVREDNTHGMKNYGWFGDNKTMINHDGGWCKFPLTEKTWDNSIKTANELADELNNEELAKANK